MAKTRLLALTGAFALITSGGASAINMTQSPQNTETTTGRVSAPGRQRFRLVTNRDAPYRTGTDLSFPAAPQKLGDYDRDLPLQSCRRTTGAGFNAAESVLGYMQNPHSTPDVTSPDVSREQIEQAQDYLKTLGFHIAADGVQGSQTTLAVMEFQMLWGPIADSMTITGKVDENLLKHLEHYAAMAERDSKTYGIDTEVMAAIRLSQLRTGEDFEFLTELIRQESNFRVGVEASTSSAVGLTQFIENTWLNATYTSGCNYGLTRFATHIDLRYDGESEKTEPVYTGNWRDRRFLLNLRANPRFAAIMGAENNQYEVSLVSHWLGRPMTDKTEKYMVHFKGVDAGYFFFKTYDATPERTAAQDFTKQARANRNIYYKRGNRRQPRSYREIYSYLDGKFDTGLYTETYKIAAYHPPAPKLPPIPVVPPKTETETETGTETETQIAGLPAGSTLSTPPKTRRMIVMP